MIDSLPPGVLLIVGALVFPALRGRVQQAWLVLLPVASFLHLLSLGDGTVRQLELFDYTLTPVRVDALSLVWGYVFHLAAFLSAIYALHVKDRWQHTAAMTYAGSAIGGVFAGDLITLFIYWELTAITSVFLIWARPDHLQGRARDEQIERSYHAGMRYLLIQVGSGVILLAGIILRVRSGGSLEFSHLGLVDVATGLIFIAFGIKAAFPLLHSWLEDAYPEATVTGTVFLSAFTTKMAIYALARGFAGTEILIYIGAAMTAFPIFFAVIVNDLRRVLTYSLNNQLGFMVCGVGLGTEMALNGTAAHAFAHILYKALLFMSMGAVLYRTGTAKGSELGGLYKSMPWTTGFCIVGAASISAFPLTSGFISKSLVLSSAAKEHYVLVYLVLLFASAGVFHHSGIKIPYFAFFAHDSGRRVKEAPLHMLIAMGGAAALCLGIGIFPGALYSILPFTVDYEPYTASHVVTQLQLLIFSALAFTVLNLKGLYPPEQRSVVLDFDWTYRKALPRAMGALARAGGSLQTWVEGAITGALTNTQHSLARLYGPRGIFARNWTTGSIALRAALMLGGYLLFYLFY
ncbi:MAG: Na(+)/H(+) antiporter subunit D [Acidobacteriota bacterium]